MSKERLEEIKKSFNFWMEEDESIGLIPEDIDWLIEQAERVQELEEELASQKGLRKKYFIELYKTKEMYNVVKNNYIWECKQNKRYLEIFEEIKKTADDYRAGRLLGIQDSFFVDEIIAIIDNLEWESDE